MLLRRVGGRTRWLPGDLPALPALLVGLWLLADVEVVTNRVADGPYTVRVLVASPMDWLQGPLGWLGLALVLAGATLGVLARKLADPGRWGTAVRFLPYRAAAFVLLVATLLSLWRLSSHVTDLGSGGVQWRFVAEPRVRWINDLTTVVLAAGSVAMLALSFGRLRTIDFDGREPLTSRPPPAAAPPPAQANLDRVPTTTAARASTMSTMPTGVATKSRSKGSASRPDSGS